MQVVAVKEIVLKSGDYELGFDSIVNDKGEEVDRRLVVLALTASGRKKLQQLTGGTPAKFTVGFKVEGTT